MAETIVIDSRDVQDAVNYLEGLMGSAVPEGDFSGGTALHDLTVKALSAVFAFVRAEARQVRQGQSLKTVASIAGASQEVLRSMVESILSNVFVTFRGGSKARGVGVGHISDLVDIFIPVGAKFSYSANQIFYLDSDQTYFIPAADLVPITDASGVILEWQFRIPMIAGDVGPGYNVTPGLFADFDRFSPYVTRIEATEKFDGGKPVESVAEALERAPTAISVRNLINARSINNVLLETYPAIDRVLTIGMGDPEMQRDRLTDVVPHLQMHIGGCTDIYIRQPLIETSVDMVVGAAARRPDGLITLFRDDGVTDWVAEGVQVGNVIRISDGFPVVPRLFRITAVNTDYLEVTARIGSDFPLATDEEVPETHVSYTIGKTGPYYVDVFSNVGYTAFTTGKTSRSLAESGRVTLPAVPIMSIVDVMIVNPPAAEAAFQSSIDSFVHFPVRVNDTPANATSPIEPLQYRLIGRTPLLSQSSQMWNQIQVGPSGDLTRWDGYIARVRYKTLSIFSAVDTFVSGPSERTSCAAQLVRGLHTVELSTVIRYRLAVNATATLNDALLSRAVASFISAFNTDVRPLDVSAITEYLRSLSSSISAIFPFNIKYVLSAPTGDQMAFETSDEVTLGQDKQTDGPKLDLLAYGVSARTVQYLANDATIVVQVL